MIPKKLKVTPPCHPRRRRREKGRRFCCITLHNPRSVVLQTPYFLRRHDAGFQSRQIRQGGLLLLPPFHTNQAALSVCAGSMRTDAMAIMPMSWIKLSAVLFCVPCKGPSPGRPIWGCAFGKASRGDRGLKMSRFIRGIRQSPTSVELVHRVKRLVAGPAVRSCHWTVLSLLNWHSPVVQAKEGLLPCVSEGRLVCRLVFPLVFQHCYLSILSRVSS
jgi:hypothetical protein